MSLEQIKADLLRSYEQDGGINHLDGSNLPSEAAVDALARGFMHLLFPGFFESQTPSRSEVADLVGALLAKIDRSLRTEIAKSLAFAGHADAKAAAKEEAGHLLGALAQPLDHAGDGPGDAAGDEKGQAHGYISVAAGVAEQFFISVGEGFNQAFNFLSEAVSF